MNESMRLLSLGLYPGQVDNVDWDIELFIPGPPKALKRHRTFKKGDFTGSYDPSAEDKATFLTLAIQHKPAVPLDEPLLVLYWFWFPRPKAHYRSGKNSHLLKDSAPVWHISTPDSDNLEKFIGDALNGIYWKDDSRICAPSAFKRYTKGPPGINIKIFRLNKLK